jgi:CheY-like chemotaxis protein
LFGIFSNFEISADMGHMLTSTLYETILESETISGRLTAQEPELNRPINVLLVEDHAEQVDWVRLVLENGPRQIYSMESVTSLIAAMNRVQEPGVDVILLDLGLPELNGYRSHTAIRQIAPQIPVIVLTADHSKDSQKMVLRDGAREYLLKGSVTPHELREAILWVYLFRDHQRMPN